jgi:hypothetical protein
MATFGREKQPWVSLVGALVALPLILASQVWTFWTMWVYLVGGTVPVLGWETGPNLVMVLVTLFVFEPIAITVAYWAYMLVMLPLALIFGHRVVSS